MTRLETLILQGLLYDREYARKVIPFLRDYYFDDQVENIIFKEIASFCDKYNEFPTKEALIIAVNELSISDNTYETIVTYISEDLSTYESQDQRWFVDKTEEFCKQKSLINAVRSSIPIIDGSDKKHTPAMLPEMFKEALSVTFDPSVGLDYRTDIEDRYEFYTREEERIASHLEKLNVITRGGIRRKTLNIIIAGTNVGKSLAMCDMAVNYFKFGYNVFYASFEMSKEEVAERIDANICNIPVNDLQELDKEVFVRNVQNFCNMTTGSLHIEDYPTSGGTVHHLRHTLNELALKKNFIPDIMFVDYLNIMASTRYREKSGGDYGYVKSIAEEVRGLASELNIAVWTATQFNRQGFGNSDADLTNTAESFGIPKTADLMISLYSSPELEDAGQVIVTQLKNRHNGKTANRRFVLGIDRSRMKLYDIDEEEQTLSDGNTKPVNDTVKPEFSKFAGFKFE